MAATKNTTTISRGLSGKRIPEEYRGSKVEFQGATTPEAIVKMGHADSVETVAAYFYKAFNIATSALVTEMANDGASLEDIAKACSEYSLTQEKATRSRSPEAVEKARATRDANKEKLVAMDALLASAANDPDLAARLKAMGVTV